MSCGICYAEKSSCLDCPKCAFKICTGCLVQYMKTQTEPVCANPECRLVFTREVISSLNSPTVEKTYREMREKFLLDIEKARLPEAQRYVALRTILETFGREIKPVYLAHLKGIRDEKTRMYDEEQVMKLEIQKHKDVWNLYKRGEYENAYERFYRFTQEEQPDQQQERYSRIILCPCPAESCRGFVMEDKSKCGVCETEVCKHCMLQVRGSSHTCDKNDIESANEVKRQSRPCPKCAIPISKIDGCDQMWCTSCHTPFSWKTGTIVAGTIHNPHFYAYQRERARGGDIPRVAGDVPANIADEQDFAFATIPGILPYFYDERMRHPTVEPIRDFLFAYLRLVQHFQSVMVIDIRRRRDGINCTDLRVKFLLNEITEKEFATAVQRRDKKHQKDLEVDACMLIFFASANRIYTDLIGGTKCVKKIVEAANQIQNLVNITNEQFEKISQVYKNKIPLIEYYYDKLVGMHVLDFVTCVTCERKYILLNFDGSVKEKASSSTPASVKSKSKSKAASADDEPKVVAISVFCIEDDE